MPKYYMKDIQRITETKNMTDKEKLLIIHIMSHGDNNSFAKLREDLNMTEDLLQDSLSKLVKLNYFKIAKEDDESRILKVNFKELDEEEMEIDEIINILHEKTFKITNQRFTEETIRGWLISGNTREIIDLAISRAFRYERVDGLGYVAKLLETWKAKELDTIEKIQAEITQHFNKTIELEL